MDYVPVEILMTVANEVLVSLEMEGSAAGTVVRVSVDDGLRPLAVIGLATIALDALIQNYLNESKCPPMWAEEPQWLRRMIKATDEALEKEMSEENYYGDEGGG